MADPPLQSSKARTAGSCGRALEELPFVKFGDALRDIRPLAAIVLLFSILAIEVLAKSPRHPLTCASVCVIIIGGGDEDDDGEGKSELE